MGIYPKASTGAPVIIADTPQTRWADLVTGGTETGTAAGVELATIDSRAQSANAGVGQLAETMAELQSRIDLLGQSGYCSTYMSQRLKLGPGRNRALPFDTQVGPAQGAQLVQVSRVHPGVSGGPFTEWCIKLNRKGLWDVRASFVHAGDGFDWCFGEVVILKPDLTPYTYLTLPSPRPHADGGSSGDVTRGAPMSFTKSVVIPDPGYYVQVRWMWSVLVGVRTAQGGAKQSHFSVVQWSDEVDNATVNDEAVGEIVDTG